MKANKIFIILTIISLVSCPLLKSSISHPDYPMANIPEESSDDAIVADIEFRGGTPEAAPYGWPKYSPSKRSFWDIERDYNIWGSEDFEGAAADVNVPKK